MNFSHKSKKIMRVVNTFRTWNGPPKFYIELEADWLIILDDARGKSPGYDADSDYATKIRINHQNQTNLMTSSF